MRFKRVLNTRKSCNIYSPGSFLNFSSWPHYLDQLYTVTHARALKPMHPIGLGSLVQVLNRWWSRPMCMFYQTTNEAKSIETKEWNSKAITRNRRLEISSTRRNGNRGLNMSADRPAVTIWLHVVWEIIWRKNRAKFFLRLSLDKNAALSIAAMDEFAHRKSIPKQLREDIYLETDIRGLTNATNLSVSSHCIIIPAESCNCIISFMHYSNLTLQFQEEVNFAIQRGRVYP